MLHVHVAAADIVVVVAAAAVIAGNSYSCHNGSNFSCRCLRNGG